MSKISVKKQNEDNTVDNGQVNDFPKRIETNITFKIYLAYEDISRFEDDLEDLLACYSNIGVDNDDTQ